MALDLTVLLQFAKEEGASDLHILYKANLIEGEEAIRQADSANNLRLRIKADGGVETRSSPRFQIRGAEEWPAA